MKFKKVSCFVLGTLLVAYGALLAMCGVMAGLADTPEAAMFLGTVVNSFALDEMAARLFLGALLSFILAFASYGTAYFSSGEVTTREGGDHA